MTDHVHRFVRISFAGLGLMRWRCSCGLKVNTAAMHALVEADRRRLEHQHPGRVSTYLEQHDL